MSAREGRLVLGWARTRKSQADPVQRESHEWLHCPTMLAADLLDPRARARRGLAVYFACLLVGTAICEGIMLRAGDSIGHHPACVVALMWTPGIASIVARVALREGFGDVSFWLRGRKGWRMAFV